MKLILPEYYKDFRCIADKCRDNCCIGWGIYIDDDTAEKYRGIGGQLGVRLRENIDREEQCFINDPVTRRCPFLNKDDLCDIITEVGEDMLCDICDRHPRYFEWYDDAIEGGIGLSCEEAARLILGDDDHGMYETEAPVSLCAEADPDEEPVDEAFYEFLKNAREKIIALLLDKAVPLWDALDVIYAYAAVLQESIDMYEIDDVPEFADGISFDTRNAVKLFVKAEAADDVQENYLKGFAEYIAASGNIDVFNEEDDKELRNIAVYFVRRYFLRAVFSGDLYPKLVFAVYGTRVINAMFGYERHRLGSIGFEGKCAAAKLFSKIVEYSEDNLWLIFDNYTYD